MYQVGILGFYQTLRCEHNILVRYRMKFHRVMDRLSGPLLNKSSRTIRMRIWQKSYRPSWTRLKGEGEGERKGGSRV